MEINSKVFSKTDEKIVLINLVGTLKMLKDGCLTIEETEKFLFSPYIIKKLQDIGCKKEIIDIFESGCELEDIASIIPDNLNKNIDLLMKKAIELLKSYNKYEEDHWIK